MTFVSATVYPLRVEVHVKMDPNNTKKLLNFDDLRLVDEHGETVGKFRNGIRWAIFRTMKKSFTYKVITSVSQRNCIWRSIKFKPLIRMRQCCSGCGNKQILKQPKGNNLNDVTWKGITLVFSMHIKRWYTPCASFGKIKDGNGNELSSDSMLIPTI